jgi:hypothetical protein
MPFINDFADLLNDTIIWRQKTGRNDFGARTFGTGITFTARVVKKTKMVRDIRGDQVVSTAQVWIGTTDDTNLDAPPNVSPEDQIELSNGQTPDILMIEQPQDESGVAAYTKVYFR